MSKVAYKYIVEDSHTWIRLEEGQPKVKVVTGEIIEIEEGQLNRMQIYLTGFRKVEENGDVALEGNDAVVAENAKKAEAEAKEAKKSAKKAKEEETKVEEGNAVPEIVVPTVAVETKVEENGDEGITVKVTK